MSDDGDWLIESFKVLADQYSKLKQMKYNHYELNEEEGKIMDEFDLCSIIALIQIGRISIKESNKIR